MIQLKFKHNIFKSSNKSIFYKSFEISFLYFIFIYIKISKNLLAKYYQENKEKLQKKACERYQSLSKEEKEIKQKHGSNPYKKSFKR